MIGTDSISGTWEDTSEPKFRVEPGSIIYPDCKIGEGSIIGANAVLRPHTIIGHHSIFGTLSCSEGFNSIGNYTTIHAQCHITQFVHIGSHVFIAPFFIASNTTDITLGKHGTEPTDQPICLNTEIGDNVRIGCNVRLIPGIKIGHDALIDQDTFVTHDVEPYDHIRGGKDKVGRVV